jgi:putative acetyltransferase
VVEVHPERPGEAAAIERVHTLAFAQADEARLVRRLNAEGFTVASIVAIDGDDVVGHVLFSRLSIPDLNAVSLAPVGVVPDRQAQGIGSQLIRKGLETCTSLGADVVIVVGEPEYYTRFGFSLHVGEQFTCVWSGPYFLALELRAGAVGSRTYAVEYPTPFQDL